MVLPRKEEKKLKNTLSGLVLFWVLPRENWEEKRDREMWLWWIVFGGLLHQSIKSTVWKRLVGFEAWAMQGSSPQLWTAVTTISTLGHTHNISKSVFRLRPVCTESKDLVRLGPDPISAKNGQLKGLLNRQLWSQFANKPYEHFRFRSDIR